MTMKEKKVPAEIYSRVSGYFRPVKQWNPGKQAEFKNGRDLQTGKYISERNEES